MDTNYNFCNYCNRHFKFKDLYTQHIIACEFFYRKKRQADRDMEAFEVLPSPQEMFKLVQHLMVECSQLRKEVDKLKNTTSLRRKQMVTDYLTAPALIPIHNFEEWTVHKNIVYKPYLEHVYEENLTEGIKMYMNDMLKQSETPPIRAFTEKPNTIYVYSVDVVKVPTTVVDRADPDQDSSSSIVLHQEMPPDTYSWKVLSNERLIKWIRTIAHKFLEEFTKMQYANMAVIMSNDTERDKNIRFMIKINGGKVSDERRCSEIRRWLMGKIVSVTLST